MIDFIDSTIPIGTIQPDSRQFINFQYTGKQSDIVFVRPHCGCTGEHVFLSQGKSNIIQFIFTESDTKTLTQQHLDIYYQDRLFQFTKQISIYLNDGQPLYITDENGNKDYNPNKEKRELFFTGAVDISNITPAKNQ